MEHIADEVKNLKACINDLISVLALPAIWTGREPSQILSTLLDVLLGMLRLDFAYARLNDSIGGAPIEMVRLAQRGNMSASPQKIGQVLNTRLRDNPHTSPLVLPNPIGEGEVSIASFRLGLQDEVGVLVAGSQRADFPTATERLLLSVAANQATIGLHEARLLSEQRRVAEELDQRVAQRTRELTAVNEELRKENIERKRAEALLAGEKRLLEMIAKGNSLSMILDALCRLVEELSKDSLSSILLLDPDGNRLWHGAAPSLPKGYTDAIDGAFIGPAAGSCGTAAYRKEPVIVSDIAQDPLWADYRDLALRHRLRACWSTPVLASDGRVLGTFAIYSREPRSPTPQQQNIIEQITDLASIAIERKRAEEERQAHLSLLEAMDQVNRAIQGTNDLEQMMSDVLGAVLSIFKCDRAWLVYPCDPQAASWKVPMEHARPEFPGAFDLGLDLPVDRDVAKVFQSVRASSSPVRFGPGSEHPLPAEPAKRFSIQSMIGMAIYPKRDKPYMLGLHQCSYPRVWTPQEERLFQEIGRRLEDALTSLSMFRNLGESERKLEEAQRLTHVGYWDRDLDTGLITWSDETYRIYGVPSGEILTLDRIQELIHSEDRPMMLAAISAALRGGWRYDVEYRVIRPDGKVRVVHSQADVTWDESGRPRRMFGTVQDITERKRAEEELRAAETRFRTYVDHATDALFVHDDQRKVVDVNRQACENLGYTREELIGMTPPDFDPALGVDDAFIQWMKERLDAGEVFAFETSHRRKDGTLLPVEVRVRPFWHGGHRFGLALVRDITERKRAEETLRQAQADLAHVTRVTTLGEMTASIAHEVNQPLAAIVTNANACLRWLAVSNLNETQEALRRIIRDGNRASDVIGRIRTLVKKSSTEQVRLEINEVIREVVALIQNEIQKNAVVLRMGLAPGLPCVSGDRIQLQQVILNLVMNAIEAMGTVDAIWHFGVDFGVIGMDPSLRLLHVYQNFYPSTTIHESLAACMKYVCISNRPHRI